MKKQDESNKKKKIHVSITGLDLKTQKIVIRENFVSEENFRFFVNECTRLIKCMSEYYEQKSEMFDFFKTFKFTDEENVFAMSVNTGYMYYLINLILLK